MQSKNFLTVPVAIIVGGVIIAAGLFFGLRSGGAARQEAALRPNVEPPAVDVRDVKTAGEPFVGDTNARVTIAYWTDYQCPFCARNEKEALAQVMKDYVETGIAKIVYKDYAFLGPDSQRLGEYSNAVWEVAPDKFFAWHSAMFENQGVENGGWATAEKLDAMTASVLGASDAGKVTALVQSKGDAYRKEMDADRDEGIAFGIEGTPAAIIGTTLIPGAYPYEVFQQAIDSVLKSK